MKSSDYIVNFFADKGIRHFFGYQGTMIAHFVDSVYKNERVENHCCCNEQGGGFAAVGYAKSTGQAALAYATSGPGACNLISAIADAYYDSAPVVFITGQLNTYEYLGIDSIRQNGFQEMDVISAVQNITKYCAKVEDISDLRYILEKAYYYCLEGRPGPVVLDIPMDMQRQEIKPEDLRPFKVPAKAADESDMAVEEIIQALNASDSPVLLLGNGIVNGSDAHKAIIHLAERWRIPIITSMLGRDLLEFDHELNFGHLGGGYGHRYANVIVYKKADLIISLGCSMCKRQTAMNTEKFAKNAKIIRVDIDPIELQRKVHESETSFIADCRIVIDKLISKEDDVQKDYNSWIDRCDWIRDKLIAFDAECEERMPNKYIEAISDVLCEEAVICSDVGQHQVWTSQSFNVHKGQQLLFSGGHGAMGFSLPASIGAHFATGKRTVAICGDGAMQMNIQELQWVFREQIPVTIIVLNNHSLGLIQQQQDDIFNSLYAGSTETGGYSAPSFAEVGKAYGLTTIVVSDIDGLKSALRELDREKPALIEVQIDTKSRAYPKTFFGEEMYNQRPYIPEELMEQILDI